MVHTRTWPSESMLAWTPRQREVLALIARGQTNPQIAEALGVSLAGAKWHVSEVLSKLGVETREDAAEYWRSRRGPGLARLTRGFSGALALKLGAGVAGAAVIAGASWAVAASWPSSNGDGVDSEPATVAETRTSIFTEAEAKEHGRYLVSEYLRQTDVLEKSFIGGRPMTADDLEIVEALFVDDGTDVRFQTLPGASSSSTEPRDIWGVVLRRDGVEMSDTGATDGIVIAHVTFEDGTGKVTGAGASRTTPALEAADAASRVARPPGPPVLPSKERAGPAYDVATATGGGWSATLHLYQTESGDWCQFLAWEDGSSGGGCGWPPDIAGSAIGSVAVGGAGLRSARFSPPYLYGIVGGRVAKVELVDATGHAVEVVETEPLPPESTLAGRAFVTFVLSGGPIVSVRAVAEDGSVLSTQTLHAPLSTEIPAGLRSAPVHPVDFSGSGVATGGAFQLPPPAFPVQLVFTVEAAAELGLQLVCDTGTALLTRQARGGPPPGPVRYIADMPPEARECHFEVDGTGPWRIQSTT